MLYTFVFLILSSGLYRRYRNRTDSTQRLVDYTTGGEFHSAPKQILFSNRIVTCYIIYLYQGFVNSILGMDYNFSVLRGADGYHSIF